jgi:hypothetical protein
MDLTKLSDSDLSALKSGDLTKLSDAGLATLKGMTPQQLANERATEIAAGKQTAPGIPYSIKRGGEMALEPMSGVERFRAGAGRGLANVAYGAGQLLGQHSSEQEDERRARDSALSGTTAGIIGEILGTGAVGAPLMLAPGANTIPGAALTGAVMGGMMPTGTGDSRLTNAILGGVAGAGGQAIGQSVNRAIRPVQSQLSGEAASLAQAAQRRGIPLDAADITGSRPLTIMRDVMNNLPLTADAQQAVRQTKQQAFNRAVGQTFGANADEITAPVLQGARNRLGQEFTQLANRNTLEGGNDFLQRLADLSTQSNRSMTPDVARVVNNHIDDVLTRMDGGGRITGQAYRALDSELGRVMRSSSNGDIRYGVGQVRDALRQAMDSSISTADQQAWREARRQYANMMTVAPLAARDATGDVSGRTLLAAAMRNQRSGAFTGGGELGELGRIGRQFIAEQTPNSGTAQRTFYQRLLTENPLTAVWQQGVGGISRPVQMLMNSPAGQRYFTQGLANLTPAEQRMVNALARSIGVTGSAYAVQQ